MSRFGKSSRARGGNRGGTGGGYERTDPDYEQKRLRRMVAEYKSLEPKWQNTYLVGLTDTDRRAVTRMLKDQQST